MSVEPWLDAVRGIFERYDEALLRPVATRLCRPRNQWPAAELIDRSLATLQNPAVVDRRLKDIPAATRKVLAVVRQSGQASWSIANLCEIGALLGEGIGHEAIVELIEAGLAFPELGAESSRGKIKQLTNWLAQSPLPRVLIPPSVTDRLEAEPLGLDGILQPVAVSGIPLESDGLEWLLRLAVVRQRIHGSPLRRTQSRDFFKRDLDRLKDDALLGSSPAGGDIADVELFAIALALALGLLEETDGEVRIGELPVTWMLGLTAALREMWAALPRMNDWNPATGWTIAERPGNPFASSDLFALVLLGQLPADQWANPDDIETAIAQRHPFWVSEKKEPAKTGVSRFLLGVAASLRLVQTAKRMDDGWAVRLSPLGRSVLGLGPPVTIPTFQQTLLVQPNLEILAYRQGLTPELIAKLGTIATWKSLGAACTLQFEPASVYHALEHGESMETIVRMLDSHGMKPTPVPVLEALRTWANKRDRITVYPSAALFEFPTANDLNEALSRGLPAVKITDRLAVVPREGDIDYKNFRLTGTRDYLLPPEKCVEVEADGVTLVVDLSRSDLLLDTEVSRFAEAHPRTPPPGRKLYRITPGTLQTSRQQGMTLSNLESWFEQRTGLPGSPAARFLFGAKETPPVEMRRQLVVHVPTSEAADGLLQWPETQRLLRGRLGPTALVVMESDVETLSAILTELGIAVRFDG